jgi:hypothetical protein
VVARVRGRLAVSKQAAWTLDVETFILRKLDKLEVRKEYHEAIKQVCSFGELK